jgi:hypothetical protein
MFDFSWSMLNMPNAKQEKTNQNISLKVFALMKDYKGAQNI